MSVHAKVDRINNLFRQTLAGGYDGEKSWSAVTRLRRSGNRLIFTKAVAWCTSDNPLKRARAANILCQLRSQKISPPVTYPTPIFVEESSVLLSRMIETETDERALASELYGLGHLGVAATVALILPFARHASADVRYAATYALGSFSNDPAAINALIALSDDSDRDIRNWATFAIGTQSDADSPELRAALVNRLDDPFKEAREEAIAGLAKRKDERAVLPLLRLLKSGSYYMHNEEDYESLLEAEPPASGWIIDDMIDALYLRFPSLLPPRT